MARDTRNIEPDLEDLTEEEERQFRSRGKSNGPGFVASFEDDDGEDESPRLRSGGQTLHEDESAREDRQAGQNDEGVGEEDRAKAPAGTPFAESEDDQPGEQLYAGKYKSVEDLEAGYKQLESRLGQPAQDAGASSVQPGEPEFKPTFVPSSEQSVSLTPEEEQGMTAVIAQQIDRQHPGIPRDASGRFDWDALDEEQPGMSARIEQEWNTYEKQMRTDIINGKRFRATEYPQTERQRYEADAKTLGDKYGLADKAGTYYTEMKQHYGGNQFTPPDPRFFDVKYGVPVMRDQALVSYAALHKMDELTSGLAERNKAREKKYQEERGRQTRQPDTTLGRAPATAKSGKHTGLVTAKQWKSRSFTDLLSDAEYLRQEKMILALPPDKQAEYFEDDEF